MDKEAIAESNKLKDKLAASMLTIEKKHVRLPGKIELIIIWNCVPNDPYCRSIKNIEWLEYGRVGEIAQKVIEWDFSRVAYMHLKRKWLKFVGVKILSEKR